MIFDTEPVNNVISFRFEIFFILYDIVQVIHLRLYVDKFMSALFNLNFWRLCRRMNFLSR